MTSLISEIPHWIFPKSQRPGGSLIFVAAQSRAPITTINLPLKRRHAITRRNGNKRLLEMINPPRHALRIPEVSYKSGEILFRVYRGIAMIL
jgi:hypothetical protein